MQYDRRGRCGTGWCGSLGMGLLLLTVWGLTVSAAPPERPPVPVIVGPVVQQPAMAAIDVVGTVEPSIATTLSAEIAGVIVRFEVREGDVVQPGKTVVAQLKATEFELALAEAEAELARAREALKKLKAGLRKEEIDE